MPAELGSGDVAPPGRVRRPGGGRIDGAAGAGGGLDAGDPEPPLRWTTRSMARLAAELTAAAHPCSPPMAWRLLCEQGFSMPSSAKVLEGAAQHPDPDAQFRYISGQAREYMAAGQPVISVDAKKELVGDFARAGRRLARKASRSGPGTTRSRAGRPGTRFPAGFTTSPRMRASSTSGRARTPRAWRWSRSAALVGPGRPGRVPAGHAPAGDLRRRRGQQLEEPRLEERPGPEPV
jgi:hypothetical protein